LESDKAKELLARERQRVEGEIARLRSNRGQGDELSNVDQHPADAATELHDAELDQSLLERLERDLEAIERAEQRVEDGTYGLSIESGEPIPDGRLEAVPWAEYTAEEQSRVDAR
jgi:RNA polymerase-binding transcription factor DksA